MPGRYVALRYRAPHLALFVIFLVLGVALAAPAQVKARAAPASAESSPRATGDNPSLSLNLCVDGSTQDPCPANILSDDVYVPMITLTYGQILDGVVAYSPPDLQSGTITLYKDSGAGRIAFCTLRIGIDQSCAANSTLFDVDDYVLSATLTFPPGSPYPGFDTNVGPCATTTTCNVTVSVAKDTSQLMLSSSQQVAPLGSPVTIRATATGGYGAIPTGQVVFTVDDVPLDPINLDATGVASFTTSTLALGTHNITASYAGSQDFYAAGETPIFRQQIVPPPTATTVTSSLNPSALGDRVTFTAAIANTGGFTGGLSGTVTFRDGVVAFSTSPVVEKGSQFVALGSTAALAAGSHNITATYSGDGSSAASVSPAYVQQVNYPLAPTPPGYRITVAPSPLVIGVGQTANLTVTVTPISGFSQAVTLSCTDLPNESTCTFGNAVIQAGGGETTLSFSTMAPHDCGSTTPYFTGSASLHRPASPAMRYGATLLAGVFLLLLPRRRARWTLPLLGLGFACGLLALNGCGGNCTDFGTNPGSYTFKVNGTTSATPVAGSGTTTSDPGAVNVTTSVAVSVKL